MVVFLLRTSCKISLDKQGCVVFETFPSMHTLLLITRLLYIYFLFAPVMLDRLAPPLVITPFN